MNKIKSLSICILTSLMILTGCNNKNGSDSSLPTDWTDEQKELLKEHLNNVVIPYISINGEVTVTYYEEYDCVSVESYTSTLDEAKTYATQYVDILNNSDGYYFIEQYEDEETDLTIYSYGFDVGVDYVYLDVYGVDYDNNPYFCIDCYYVTRDSSWPTDLVNNYISICKPIDWSLAINIPALTGGDIYEPIEYFDYGILFIEVFSDNYETLSSQYDEALKNASFVYDEENDFYYLEDSTSETILYIYNEINSENSSVSLTFLFA